MKLTRRSTLIAGASSLALPMTNVFGQGKAEFTLKYANNLPVTHPMNIRAKEMSDAIKAETQGRVDLGSRP